MNPLPFHLVTLSHPTWEEALRCARQLGEDALPELRLDLFPGEDPEALVDALHRRCLVTCRRTSEGGRWPDDDEPARLAALAKALRGKPAWVDLEWDLPIPPEVQAARTHVRLLRSVHVAPGVFDLEARLGALPEGEAYKWVGWAEEVADCGRLRPALARARDHRIRLAAFLMGPKGLASRVMQGAWGGAFIYAAPDDGPPAAPGQLPLATLREWRSARLHPGHGLCGVVGDPVLHSRGPAFHNPRFQAAFKDLVYLPFPCATAEEAVAALEGLPLLGVSITAPLKASLPAALGLRGPLNTLWRRAPGGPWQGANTDAEALREAIRPLAPGPVLLLGDGGVASASRVVLEEAGREVLQVSRRRPLDLEVLRATKPVGVLQATSLGMAEDDPLPFPAVLEVARPFLRWGVEWIYKETTAFERWCRDQGLPCVDGAALFQAQAEAQNRYFIAGCGG